MVDLNDTVPLSSSLPSGDLAPLALEQWNDPAPLPPALPTVPTLPLDLLPESLCPWIGDASDRTQVPPEFIATPALVGLGSVIGRRIGIYPKQHDDWLVVANLWGLLIGRPGVLKTPAASEALRPLSNMAVDAQKEFQDEAARREARLQIAKSQVAAAQDRAKAAAKAGDDAKLAEAENDLVVANKDLETAETSERRYIINDGTVEKIGELLNENPNGLLLYRDELSGWLRNLEKSGREGDREFYLESWNGTGGYTYDRIGRGTLHIPALCLSIIGTIQPGKLASYISGTMDGGAGDDGLVQRFQVAVWPDTSAAWKNVDRIPDLDARDRAYDVFRRLDNLSADQLGAVRSYQGIPALRFAPDAQELFFAWWADLEKRLRSPEMEKTPGFEAHLSKYRSLLPALALILHLADVVDGGASGPVALPATQRAASLCDFLELHARKIYASEVSASVYRAHLLKDKIEAGAVNDGDRVRDIYRHHWSGLATPEGVFEGIQVLARHNIVQVEEYDTSGRSAEIIRINPRYIRGAR